MQQYQDEELIEMLKVNGKEFTLSLIVNKYKEPLYWHIRKITIDHDDADDVLQNTFIKAWKGLDGFRADSKLYTWLYRIATNESINFLKGKKKKATFPIDINDEMLNKLESDVYFNGDEIQFKLQKAIMQLPDKQRIVFNMKYFDNITYNQMSAILETSEGALKASYHHAVKKIEEFLKSN
ncbi:MAG: RNA polymerase sigma factor [Bacteroidales bacterium]|nr:RNA polymerase sigma factor [Bacteroidales bacterium]